MINDNPHTLGELENNCLKTLIDVLCYVVRIWLNDTKSGWKEIGKLLGFTSEWFLEQYVKKYCPNVEIVWRKDLSNWINLNPDFSCMKNDDRITWDLNGSGFDIVAVNRITKKYSLIQNKFRTQTLHFSNTRRHSNKKRGCTISHRSCSIRYMGERCSCYAPS